MHLFPIFKYLITGSMLGLTAGLAPGPLLTLVITETIRKSRKEGMKIALSPLITDVPIILITLLVFYNLSGFNTVLGIISILGGIYIGYLSYETIRTKDLNSSLSDDDTNETLKKGIITNLLSPHPYLFWATVGSPFLIHAFKINIVTAILFLFSFYLFLVGSKIMVAYITARTKSFINQEKYTLIMKILGVLLFIFAIMFFYDGIKYLK